MKQPNVSGMLDGYRALDLTDAKGFLCGKILADLGVRRHQSRAARG